MASISTNNFYQNNKVYSYVSDGVNSDFSQNALDTIERLGQMSSTVKKAVDKIDNVLVLKDNNSEIPNIFEKTANKFKKDGQDCFGFVSKKDNAIVLVEDNHKRKNVDLEGNVSEQVEDTMTHEIGHIIDDELSSTEKFKEAYLTDLKNISQKLQDNNAKVCGEDLKEILVYEKHYMEGVNFEDGIDEKDITREGLRENFAEAFSNSIDSHRSKINDIYEELFPNTTKVTKEFVI